MKQLFHIVETLNDFICYCFDYETIIEKVS